MTSRFSPEGLTLGATLVALGVLGLLASFGVVETLPLFRRYWPLSLVLWGVLEILQARAARAARQERQAAAARGESS